MHYSLFWSQFVSAMVTFCAQYSSQLRHTITLSHRILIKQIYFYVYNFFLNLKLSFGVPWPPKRNQVVLLNSLLKFIKGFEQSGITFCDILCAILLPAQAHNHAITQDSDQTNTFLWPQLFSKSEIEFLVSPDPIKEVKKLKTRTQVPNS